MPEAKNENLMEAVIDPRDLVAYQPGSIVSRMLVYTRSGTITVFAFDAAKGSPSTPHPTTPSSRSSTGRRSSRSPAPSTP